MSSSRGGQACPKRSPKILWREVDGSAVLFHEDTGRAFALNETASRIWKMCDGGVSVEDISARLGGPREEIEKLIEALAGDGCVEMAVSAEKVTRGQEAPARPQESWLAPSAEEIVFAACDCTGGGKGVVRNAQCVDVPRKNVSTV